MALSYDDGSDDEYSAQRDAARQRLSRAITGSRGQNIAYGQQAYGQQQNEMLDAQKAAAGGSTLQGGLMGGMVYGPQGAAVGAGLGALAGGKRAFDARREQGQGFWGALGGAATDALNPINMLSSPMAMPAAQMAGQGLSAPSTLGGYTAPTGSGTQMVGNQAQTYKKRYDQFGNENANFEFKGQ